MEIMNKVMIKLLLLMLLQTAMLVFGQVFLKLGMQQIGSFSWNAECILQVLTNLWLLVGIILLIVANVYWLWLLNKFPFSVIYPLTSMGFMLGMLSGMLVFHETVDWAQWLGVCLVIGGCLLIAK